MPTARADSATTNGNTPVTIAVLGNDSGPSLTIRSVTVPANGTARINPDKTVTYTPAPGFTGYDGFSYTVADSGGATAQGTVSVAVRNRPPVAGADDAATDAGTSVRISILANDSDPDGHALAVGTITQPANGTVVANADRTLRYTPKAGFTGTDTFGYALNDGRGGSVQGSVAMIVRNRQPAAGADSAATDANTPVRIAVLANDSDPDGHTLTVAAVTQPAAGAAAVNPDGTVRYTPAAGFTGADAFTYSIADGHGGTAQAPVAITVRNRPPVARPDQAATELGTPVTIAVLANDDDPDGHPLAVTAVTQPAHGGATVNADNTVTYGPAAGYVGGDGFGYTVADGRGGTAQDTVGIEVRAMGEPFSDGSFFTDGTGWFPATA